MTNLKSRIFYLFLFIFLIVGSITSLNVGISHDEWHEEENWKYNVALSKNIKNHVISSEKLDEDLENYKDKYYGIGFQFISQPIQFFLKKIIKNEDIDGFGSKLVSKHLVVFLFFFGSGICLYLILKKIINNDEFCYFGTLIYLLYPYLFGQSLFSPKDIPFMSAWIFCTYISFNVFENLIEKNNIATKSIIFLAISTAFLLSIRVTGILILAQYLISLIIYLTTTNINFIKFLKQFYFKILIFIFFVLLFIYIFYPLYWLNPLLLITAIQEMGRFYNDVCTNTLGTCMYAKDLPPTYLPIWLSVKLPFLILLGIFLIPFTEKKIFTTDKKNVFFGTILATSILIPLILIFRNVTLYDELRHIMFLIPLFFIIGAVSLYSFSKNFFYTLCFVSISIFIFENIKIHPYQYVWFNLPSRALDLTSKFELEYQGISGKELAKKISVIDNDSKCILVSPLHSVKPFLDKNKFNCFAQWQLIDTNYKRPFLAVQHVRNLKKSMPYKCKTISETGFKLLFHKKKFITGKLLECI